MQHLTMKLPLLYCLDSGASHHVISDLGSLSLHRTDHGYDEIMISDRLVLPIIHTSSSAIPTSSHIFTLKNVLCVLNMKKNLISIYQFCENNNIFVEFSPLSFHVKDLHT